nr:glutamate racemase [Candidatus Dadabacteria bacterium]NIQ16243.1 glutamate racemase [Candidatus Dadabacteria bacterium]
LKEKLDIPVVGVIEPGAKKASQLTKNGKIGIIGTPSTINSEAYTKKLKNLDQSFEIVSKPCPLFVPLAEEGWQDDEITKLVASKYLNSLKDSGLDVLILGCTHYPILKDTIADVMGEKVYLVDSAEETARATKEILNKTELRVSTKIKGSKTFYLTDTSQTFISVAGQFLGEKIEEVSVVDIV